MRREVLSIVLALVINFCCFAVERSPRAADVVTRLVSPNQRVNPKREPFVGFPSFYDREAQKTVEQAADELLILGFSAIPELIRHLDDDRYCRTWSYSVLIDTTVGDECFRLIDEITNPDLTPNFEALPKSQFREIKGHPMRLGIDGEWDYIGLSYFDLLIHRDKTLSRKSIATWWNSFSDKSIDHIHLAAIQRLIAHEEKIGFHIDSNKQQYLKPYDGLEKQLRLRLHHK